MIAFSLRRPVTVTMCVLALVVFGVISYTRLGRDLLPDISLPSLTILTHYEGAAPQEVEEFVTKPLEQALATVKGKRRIQSVSREGLSLITIEFEWGQDMRLAMLHVREKLDVARVSVGFPQDAERPNILRWDPASKPVVGLAITADIPILQLREAVHDVIKPRLEQLDGVAFAQISGDIIRVIDVEIDRDKISLYGLGLDTIASSIRTANVNIAGGSIKKGRYRFSLRTLGEFNSVQEINNVVVARKNGADIRVSDIARVHDTYKDREAMASVSGKDAIGLLVYKEAGANTIQATKLIKKLLEEFKTTQPDYNIVLAYEEAQFIEQALNNVWTSLIFGGIFAFVVLILFLGDLKSPLFIFISIPIAIIVTIILMYSRHLSLNLMSLGGLALGVGMLVDNSIVVLENIYRHREMGRGPMEAALIGTREVALPVAASTLTTIAVFFPIIYLEGIAGELFGEQAQTVTFSLLSSLLVSVTVLPLLTAVGHILEGRDRISVQVPALPRFEASQYARGLFFWKWWELLVSILVCVYIASYFKYEWSKLFLIVIGLLILPAALALLKWLLTFFLAWLVQIMVFILMSFSKAFQLFLDKLVLPVFNFCFRLFERVYHHALDWCLENKAIALSSSMLVFLFSLYLGSHLQRELMPKSATGQFTLDIKLPAGTAIENTALTIGQVETYLTNQPEVEVAFSQIGSSEANLAQLLKESGTNTGQISVRLKPEFVSLAAVYRLGDQVRAFCASKDHGIQITLKESESAFEQLLSSEGGSGLVIQIEGENLDQIRNANEKILAELAKMPEIKDIHPSLVFDFPQMQIQMKRENIERYGFSIDQVGSFLSNGMRGDVATQYKEFDRSIDVRVRFREEDREQFDRVMTSTLTSASGSRVPLSELIEAKLILGTKEVQRINQRRVALISANAQGKKISEIAPLIENSIRNLNLPRSVSARLEGEQRGISDSFGQLLTSFILSAILVYMIMAAQFESLRFPFIVIFTVPMGIIGAIGMLYFFGQSINIMSLIGLIVLTGIGVNDAIVKVEFISEARAQGATVREAILQASRVRLRPILMTTLTTVLGLFPMAFAIVPKLMALPLIHPCIQWLDLRLAHFGIIQLEQLFSPRGSEIQQPLALVIMGGLSVATLLTLLLTPLLYELFAQKSDAPKIKETQIEQLEGEATL